MSATILVIEGDPKAQRLLREILVGAGYNALVASDGLEGLRLLAMESPGLVLLDVALPSSDGYQLVTRIRREEGRTAHIPIIMLTAERDVEQKIRSLRAGADDYLVKPTDPTFHPAELLARTRSLLARFAPPEREAARPVLGRVLGFYGAKGGVGTTTIAINTAIALQREGRSVCLLDGNLQFGDHRVFLDLGTDLKSVADVATAPGIEPDTIRHVVAKHESGIGLLLAPPSPESADLVRPEHMTSLLTVLRTMYDYVIVDLDKRLDDTNLGMIEVADTVYLVLNADLACLKNVRLVLQALGHLGYDAGKFKLVMNRSTAVTGISVKSAEGALKRPIDYRIVNDYRAAISSLNSGAPFQVSKADSAIGRSVQEFVKAIDGEKPAPATPAPERPMNRPAFLRR
jgi:pilus assembly protein CpaE